MFAFGLAETDWSFAFLLIVMLSGIVGFFHEMAFVALEGTIPRLLSIKELPRAQSVLQGLDQTGQVLGPALAAFLSSFFPLQSLFLLVAGFFVFSALSIWCMLPARVEAKAPALKPGELGCFIATGVRLVAETPALRCLVVLTILVNLMVGVALAASAGYIQLQFGRLETDFGVMNSAAGGVGVLSFFAIPRLIRRMQLDVVGSFGFLSLFVGGIVMGLADSFLVYAAGFVGMMVSVGFVNVFIRTVRVRFIPEAQLSTTIGVIVLLNFTALPVSGLLVSALSEAPGIPALLIGLGLGSLAVGVLLLARLRGYLKYAGCCMNRVDPVCSP